MSAQRQARETPMNHLHIKQKKASRPAPRPRTPGATAGSQSVLTGERLP